MKILNKIIEYGLYLLAFILPWQTRLILRAGEINGGYWEYGTISLYLVDIILLIVLGVFVISQFADKTQPENYKPEIHDPWLAIAFFELSVFVSIFFSPDKLLAVYGYFKFLLGVGLFWLVMRASYNRGRFFLFLLWGMAIQSILGIWQFIFQTSFASKWFGIAIHSAGELGTSVVETSGERWLRAYGGFDHPNIFGGALALGLLFLVILKITNQSKQKNILYYFFVMVFSLGLFFSFSRGAWIGLAAGIITLIIYVAVEKYETKELAKTLFIIFFIFGFLFSIYQNLVMVRLIADNRLENKSNQERQELLAQSRSVIGKNFLFGVGIGNYGLAVKEYISPNEPSYFYQPVHNVFLLILSEVGIFGLIFFLWFIFSVTKGALKEDKDAALLSPIFVFLIVAMMVDHWWWSLHFGVLFFWLSLGLLYKKQDNAIV